MRSYFGNYSIVEYNGQKIRNIMHSAQLAANVLDRADVWYPYTLQDGDTPTMIAFDYYGSIEYVWLVLFSNNITDPTSEWHKSQEQFDAFLIKKYGSIEAAMSEIHHYEKSDDATYPPVTPTTYEYMTTEEKIGLSIVYTYDYEMAINEARRSIRLIDRGAASKIAFELETTLK